MWGHLAETLAERGLQEASGSVEGLGVGVMASAVLSVDARDVSVLRSWCSGDVLVLVGKCEAVM